MVRVPTVPAFEFIPPNQRWGFGLAYVGELWIISFTLVLVWKRAGNREAQFLALLLFCLLLSAFLAFNNFVTPWPVLDASLDCLSQIAASGVALLAAYAMLFARPVSRGRRILAWLSYAAAAATTIVGIAQVVAAWTGVVDPNAPIFGSFASQIFQDTLPNVLPLLCAFAALAAARGAERTRIAWAVASLCILYVVDAAVPLSLFFPQVSFNDLQNFAVFIAPIGLTYSLLGGRLMDAGFALNRAAVFSGVSVIVVGAFVCFEWLFTKWFEGATHTENALVGGAVALALGFSVRAIHGRVDRVMDELFFRKRHEDEAAIRRFAEEAPYISDRKILVERTRDVLSRHADASFVAIVLEDRPGMFGDVSENDRAIVALRATRNFLDLHEIDSELRGDFAFPMFARGRLMGALLLGPKRLGASYAPDETQAIGKLAHGLAGALDVLSTREDSKTDLILQAILQQIADLAAVVGASRRDEPRYAETRQTTEPS